jgi:hypothetical protein
MPQPTGEPDLVTLDTTWGTLQPVEPVAGIRTVGELEVAERTLSHSGYPLDRLAYHRGGMHDWITLALPTDPT